MKKILNTIFLLSFNLTIMAQNDPYPFRKWSIEPAIGSRISSAFGLADIQVSVLVQYNLHKRLNLASHSAVSFDINSFKAFKNIRVNRSITKYQKFGIGTSVYTQKSSNSIFLMMGFKDFYYSASINNPNLQDIKTTKFNTISFDKGLMYNLKIGRSSPYFSSRIYAPIFEGKWIAIENTAVELGVGVKLK
jgi:hypothetical protein